MSDSAVREPCPGKCGAVGKLRFIRGDAVYFWRRDADGIWWPDYSGPGGGAYCGYCFVPAQTLLESGVATPTKDGGLARADRGAPRS